MTLTSEIQIQLYGAFRDFCPEGVLTLPRLQGETAQELKKRVQSHFSLNKAATFDIAALVEKSVLASDQKIFSENENVEVTKISILPPVCGG